MPQVGPTITQAQTHDAREAFGSLGDVVYWLTVAPWTVPEFDLEQDLDALLALERDFTTEQGIVLKETRFIIEAFEAP